MPLCKSYAVVLDIIPAAALDLGDLMRGAGEVCYHRAPVQVAVSDAGEGTAALFCQLIELFGYCRRGIPRIQRFLACGYGVNAVFCADSEDIFKLRHRAARCDYAHIGLELAHASVGIGRVFDRDSDMGEAVADYFGDIFADVIFVAAERADKLPTVLKDVTHKITAHFACTVLYYSDFAIHLIASLF